MKDYSIHYIDQQGRGLRTEVSAIGLAEAVDHFIEFYCPVTCITAVQMVVPLERENKESKEH